MNRYRVTVTDYTTDHTETYDIEAADGDLAFDCATYRIDPTGEHIIGGHFHRLCPTTPERCGR